jgi:hypothetical protein
VAELYEHSTRQWIEQLPSPSPKVLFVGAKCTTILRNLLIYGFEAAADQQDVRTFVNLAIAHLTKLYELCAISSEESNLDPNLPREAQTEVLRQIMRLLKLFCQLVDDRAFEFLAIENSPNVIWIIMKISEDESSALYQSTGSHVERTSLLEKLFTNGLFTIRHLLRAKSEPNRFAKSMSPFRVTDKDKKPRPEQTAMANKNLDLIFTQDTVGRLTFMLLKSFLPLTPSDFEAWETDPEQWALETLGEVGGADSNLSVRTFPAKHLTLDSGGIPILCSCFKIHRTLR